jgi:hypothetical protein
VKVEQIYTGCLAQGAYYIECNGEAAVIDPLREVEPYISKAERNHATIKFVFELIFMQILLAAILTWAKKPAQLLSTAPMQNQHLMRISPTMAKNLKLAM